MKAINQAGSYPQTTGLARPLGRHRSAMVHRFAMLALLGATACLTVKAHAAPLPPCSTADGCNDGGALEITNSTSATIGYTNTFVTNTVNNYSTTLLALLDGTPVYSMNFLVPFSDPTVTSAIATADGILLTDGASFGGPSLLSTTSVLQSSTITPPATYTCLSAEGTGPTYITGETSTTTTSFGPVTISVGDCHSLSFFVIPGQTDINVNTDNQFTLPVQTITTNTYLNSQTYQISGTTRNGVPVVTPEPASLELALTGLGAIGWRIRRRQAARGTSKEIAK